METQAQVQEKSLRVYDTKKTFFTKIGTTFSKIFAPTKIGFNNLLVGMKRNAMIRNYYNIEKFKEDEKKELAERKFEESYSLYLESIDQLIIETIYKKVKNDTATDFEKEALSKYYNVIHLKEVDETEYKYKKQQYLIALDYRALRETNKDKQLETFKPIYIKEMDRLYKALLKEYSIKISERLTPSEKEVIYEKIFYTLGEYVSDIIPMKKIEDKELIKECSLFETYEVGKLDQVDILDKNTILLGISRKLFVHSLPMIVAEKCYVKLLKDTRNLIVDTKILRKRQAAYQLLLRIMKQYAEKLLDLKIYWNDNDAKKEYGIFKAKRNNLEKEREKLGFQEFERREQILFIREDMKYLERYNDKYYRILKFYRSKLVELNDMKQVKNKCRTIKDKKFVKAMKRIEENEAAC